MYNPNSHRVNAWFGREDTPAPQGSVFNPAPELTVGVARENDGVRVIVRYRKVGMPWQRLEARKGTQSTDAQYYTVRFPRFPMGAQVEYEVLVKSSGLRSIPEHRVGEICRFEISQASYSTNKVIQPVHRSPAGEPALAARLPRVVNQPKPQSVDLPRTPNVEALAQPELEIIPEIEPPELVMYRVVGQVLDEDSGTPLIQHSVYAYLSDGNDAQDLSSDFTDNQGRFELIYTEPIENSKRPRNRGKLRFHILEPDGEEIYQTEIKVIFDQEQDIVISVPSVLDVASPTLEKVASQTRLNLSPKLIQTLDKKGIRTLSDIRKSGGLRQQKELQLDVNNVELLDAHARFSTLIPDIDISQTLINKGFDSPISIARMPLTKFVERTRDELSEVKATQIHVQALAQKRVLDNILTGIRVDLANGQKRGLIEQFDPSLIKNLTSALPKCSCRDCESVISPLAYLADLLDYALTHLEDDGKDINLEWLYQHFHQPFHELPVTCGAMEEEIRQVRLAVEVLRGYLGHYSSSSKPTLPPSNPQLGSFSKAIPQTTSPSSLTTSRRLSTKAPNASSSVGGFQTKTIEPDPIPPKSNPGLGFVDVSVIPHARLAAEKNYRVAAYNTLLSQIGTSYDELRLARVAAMEDRKSLAERLGIAPEHLDELLIDITDGAHPTEAELEDLFGLQDTTEPPFPKNTNGKTTSAPPKLQTWRLQYLRSLWQEQDHPTDPYVEELRPIIDPDVISPADFRQPLLNNSAYELWQQRRLDINTHLQDLQDTLAQTNNLTEFLQARLGQTVSNLDALSRNLQTGQDIENTLETILNLGLTMESFNRLMGLQANEQAGIALEPEDRTELAAILTQAYKVQEKFPVWIEEEQEQNIILGPQHFVIAVEEPDQLPRWLASKTLRQEWQETLGRNSLPAIIVPYTIDADYFKSKTTQADQLWQERQEWADQLKETLKPKSEWQEIISSFRGKDASNQASGSRNSTDNPKDNRPTDQPENLSKLEIMLDRSGLEISLRNLAGLISQRAKGKDITLRLQGLNLTNAAFAYLAQIYDLTVANAPILNSEWEEVGAILVRAAMQRRFALWRQEEREANITLDPEYFEIPEIAEAPEPLPKWLTSWQERRNWEDKLQARIDQEETIIQALQDAVSATEAATLPMLRDALIQATKAKGNSLAAKAKWLSDRLLIDFQTSGCQVTTRVSQAIETLQSVIWSVRTGQLQDTYPKLKLVQTLNFEEEWKWLGSYANWRAAIFVFIYPENILIPTLRKWQTPGFCNLVETVRRKQTLTPTEAQDAANEYADYFREICNLEVQVSCQVDSELYFFALHKGKGRVYSNTFKNTLERWSHISKLTDVVQIIGAIPYIDSSGTTFIYLFAKSRESSEKKKLVYTRLNLKSLEWDATIEPQLPSGAETDFSAIVNQSSVGGALTNPIVLVVKVPSGKIDITWFNHQGTGFANEQWIPLFGASGLNYELCTLIQRSQTINEYVLIVRTSNNLSYRTLCPQNCAGSTSDAEWRLIAQGDFLGALAWPGTDDIFVFNWTGESTKYHLIGKSKSFQPGGFKVESIGQLFGWLQVTAGVELTYFYVDICLKKTIKLFMQTAGSPPETIDAEIPYQGNLLDLLDLTWWGLGQILIEALDATGIFSTIGGKYLGDYTEEEWIRFFQKEGLDYLEKQLKKSQDFDNTWQEWTLADRHIRQFSSTGIGLSAALLKLLDGQVITFKSRGFQTESIPIGIIGSKKLVILPLARDSRPIEPQPEISVARKYDQKFSSIKLKRSGNKIIFSVYSQLVPLGEYFTISSWHSTLNLPTRKQAIQKAFEENQGAPASVLMYLEEAYYFVPIYLALQLSKSHYYTSALNWFRTIYDYSAPSNNRKIYTGPIFRAPSNPIGFGRADDWLLDPLNPHAIALRRGYHSVHFRFILISLISCFLDYADAEFSRDTVESVARARTLYTTALELLDVPELKQELGWCQDLIGSIEFEIGLEKLRGKTQQELSKINEPKLLDVAITGVKKILKEDSSEDKKLSKIKTLIREIEAQNPPSKTLATIVQSKSDRLSDAYTQLLTDSRVSKTTNKVSKNKGDSFIKAVSNYTIAAEAIRELQNVESSPQTVKLAQFRPSERISEVDAFQQKILEDEPPIPPFEPVILEFFPFDETKPLNPDVGFTDYEYAPELSIDFCIPSNPILRALRQRAELALYKIRNCLNIGGMRRELAPYAAPTDTVSGLPLIGSGNQLVLPGANLNPAVVALRPTLYRYTVIIERAKQLVQLAAQIETAMLSAIEKWDNEAYTLLKAQQDAAMARAGVRLQDLRLQEAASGVILAQFQQAHAQIQVDHFEGLLSEGTLQQEADALDLMKQSADLQDAAAGFSFAAAASYQAAVVSSFLRQGMGGGLSSQATALSAMSSGLSSTAGVLSTKSSILSTQASYERRRQDWEFQKNLSAQDVLIGAQQIQIAQQHTVVVRHERAIAEMQVRHAEETIDFLTNKFTNVALYDWMSGVLEGVYSYFLQQATSMAKLAADQLGFERQEFAPAFIQSDYWDAPGGAAASGNGSDRRGLTGSARLQQDIYQLDQYAFETNRRKLQLSKIISLSRLAPVEFQRLRETGVMPFATPMELFDRDFPGHYLRLIHRVYTSVIALIPPAQGICATLSTTGVSRVVIGGDIYQTTTMSRGPESVALSAPFNATGVFELQQQPEMLLPFEGIGVDSTWEFRMDKASNFFDYSTIADVLITIEYTALNSYDYRQQVIQKLDNRASGDRPFSFRTELADQWYDLNNPDQTATPMVVRFQTGREDFPANIQDLKIQHVVLYFVRQDSVEVEVPVTHFHFTEDNSIGTVGGGAQSIDGIISTRRGNAPSWTAMIGRSPYGEWELAFPDAPSDILPDGHRVRDLFEEELIENMLFVITYSGRTPGYSV